MENTCLRATEDDRTCNFLSDPSAESVKILHARREYVLLSRFPLAFSAISLHTADGPFSAVPSPPPLPGFLLNEAWRLDLTRPRGGGAA